MKKPPHEAQPSLTKELRSIARSPSLVVDLVRTVFGMNISETAEVFGITRQTVYQWMELTKMDQVRSHENRDRIKQLYGAAQLWQSLPTLKGRWLHSLLPTGNTVLDLLKESLVNLDALQDAHKALLASEADRRHEEGERTTQAVTALADALREGKKCNCMVWNETEEKAVPSLLSNYVDDSVCPYKSISGTSWVYARLITKDDLTEL